MSRINRLLWIGLLSVIAFLAVPAVAQDGGTQVPGIGLTPGLPFENAAKGRLSNRRPGLMIQESIHYTRDITQTEEERDNRAVETRKRSVQYLFAILDGLQQAIMNALNGLNLVNDLSSLTDALGTTNQPTPTNTTN